MSEVPYRENTRWREAAEGGLEALQMLRDDVLDFCVAASIPWDEALAQTEVIARMAAARGEPTDVLCLISILLLRANYFRTVSDIEVVAAHDYAKAGEMTAFQSRLDASTTAKTRAEQYEREARALYPKVAHGDDPAAAAMLVSALTMRADNGDDEALATIQVLIDGMAPTNLGAVKAAIRNLEQEQLA